MFEIEDFLMYPLHQILRRALDRPGRPAGPVHRGLRPALEGLERRSLLSTMYASTTTTIVGAPIAVYGQPVSFSATVNAVAPAPGSPTPTGTVQFEDNGVDFGAPVPLTAGTATSASTSTLPSGPRMITAVYSGDFEDAPSAGSFTQTVNPAATTTAVYGIEAYVAPVTPGGATPTGTVQFVVDGTDFGAPVPLNSSAGATLPSTPLLPPGLNTVSAVYSGDANYLGSTGKGAGWLVQTVNSRTTVTSSPPTPVYGQPVTLTATVAPTLVPGGPTPTGTVQFEVDGYLYDAPVPVAVGAVAGTGVAELTITTPLAPGQHTVVALYSGDMNYTRDSSSVFGLTVNPVLQATTTIVSANPPTSVYGQPVTFTATVASVAPGGGIPTGTVQFVLDNGVYLGGPVPLSSTGTATSPSVSNLNAVGWPTNPSPHTIYAYYSGDSGHAASSGKTIETVNKAATTVTVSSHSLTALYGVPLTFTATVAAVAPGGGMPTGSVQFLVDGKDFGAPVVLGLTQNGAVVAVSPATSTLPAGQHTITAVYSGGLGYLASTGTVIQTVEAGVTITTVSPGPVSVYGQPVTFAATVRTITPGIGTATGTVQFLIDGVPFGRPVALNVVGSAASASISTLKPGMHTIAAVYSGDAGHAPSTGTATQTVKPAVG